ncbi:MAG: efflux RND transporter permease subunit [Thermales bacterium]|nr:efflux RND transporter permease subunit [Thermales bacterium]
MDTGERDLVAKEVVDEIEVDLKQYEDEFFDLVLGVESNGPPAAGWQVALGVSSSDSRLMRTSSVAVGQTLQKLCQRENQIKILDDCGGKDGDIKLVSKVDNGFVGKESSVIDIQLEREKLAKENLVNPALPVGINVVEGVKNLFEAKNQDESTIELNGEEFNLKFSRTNLIDSVTTQDIETTELGSLAAPASTPVQLSEVATIKEDIPQSTINRVNGEVINVVQARLVEDWSDEATAGQAIAAVVDYYAENDYQRTDMLGLEDGAIEAYSEGSSEGFAKSFQELIVALLLAIILTYFVLAVFFGSLTMPLVVLYTIPLTFIGIFPAIAYLSLGEFGFLEIIGMIILVGIVENVAIFLVDSARQYMREGMEEKEAIALASAIRMRPVILTNLTATASLAPLALFSEFYRSLSLVIIFGLLTSGLISLITTPILFIFFHWLSKSYREMHWINRVLFFPLFPFYIIYLGFKGRYKVVKVSSSRGVNLYEN